MLVRAVPRVAVTLAVAEGDEAVADAEEELATEHSPRNSPGFMPCAPRCPSSFFVVHAVLTTLPFLFLQGSCCEHHAALFVLTLSFPLSGLIQAFVADLIQVLGSQALYRLRCFMLYTGLLLKESVTESTICPSSSQALIFKVLYRLHFRDHTGSSVSNLVQVSFVLLLHIRLIPKSCPFSFVWFFFFWLYRCSSSSKSRCLSHYHPSMPSVVIILLLDLVCIHSFSRHPYGHLSFE